MAVCDWFRFPPQLIHQKFRNMRQIIKCFKDNEDFNFDRPLNINMPENENEGNSECFTKHLLCGVVWGLTAKYAAPVAAVYEVMPDGTERLMSAMHAYRSYIKK